VAKVFRGLELSGLSRAQTLEGSWCRPNVEVGGPEQSLRSTQRRAAVNSFVPELNLLVKKNGVTV